MIPPAFIQDLLARIDIVDIVGRQVQLKKAGANFSGLCPFHAEKSPSFTVAPAKQFYHCFGCGAHGDAIRFLIEHSGMSFLDAVSDLAQQAGLSVPEDERSTEERDRDEVRRQRQSSLADVLGKAAEHYRRQLKASPRAIDYLKRRGLTGDIAARFRLGYAPEGWRSLASAFASYDDPLLAESGMVIVQEAEDPSQSKRYDRFRDRIMFPIRAVSGDTIGFGGRVLDRGEPKYLNSPETPVFVKGRELYGLFEARAALRQRGYALVVEGYMDVVALAQAGFENAVATLGTACTGEHVQKLLRFTDAVVFSFDGDAAGRRAAARALEASLPHASDTRSLRFLFLPPEHDPDSYVREHGAEAFEQAVAAAVPLSRQLLHTAAEGCDLGTAEGRARLVAQARPWILQLPSEGVLRGQIVAALAELSKVGIEELRRQFAGASAAGRAPAASAGASASRPASAALPALLPATVTGGPGLRRPGLRRSLAPMASSLDRAVWLLSHRSQWWEELDADAHALLMEQPAPYGEFFAWLDRRLRSVGALSHQALLADLGQEAAHGGLEALCTRVSQFHDVSVGEETRAELEVVVDRLRLRVAQDELDLLASTPGLSSAARDRQRELLERQRVLKDRLARPVTGH